MLIVSALHHPETGWWAWAALILWLVERIWRCGRILRLNCRRLLRCVRADGLDGYSPVTEKKSSAHAYRPPPGYAHAEVLSGATIRLTYVSTRTVQWAPGQHFLLTIPAISMLDSHPFTCATISSKPDSPYGQAEMVFIIRAKNGWTKSLWDLVVHHAVQKKSYIDNASLPPGNALPSSGLALRMFVDGPFGSSVRVPWQDHSTILIVVGGSGVTFGLSVLDHLCCILATVDRAADTEKGRLSSNLQRIRFVWLVREFGKTSFHICE